MGGVEYLLQHNPARIRSSAASVDVKSVAQRPCFLCREHRPAEQMNVDFAGRYEMLVNPFPIFQRHLTIASKQHEPQLIKEHMGDMLDLAALLSDYTVFYNGPKCGASAPDHLHFQAAARGAMPIEHGWQERKKEVWWGCNTAHLYALDDEPRHALVIEGRAKTDVLEVFDCLYAALPCKEDEDEPRLNLLVNYVKGQWQVFVIVRGAHRPACYGVKGEGGCLCSPASVDMGGLFILPVAEDFERMDSKKLTEILSEVCWSEERLQCLRAALEEQSGAKTKAAHAPLSDKL